MLLLGGGSIAIDLIDKLNSLSITSFQLWHDRDTGIASSNGNCRQALSGREIKILDTLIYVKGETLFLGYLSWHKSHLQLKLPLDEKGWFLTKDRGYWDKQDNLHILGRCDNMFVCGDENLQAEEIKAVLKQHKDIDDAIVFPQVDRQFSYLPAAIIKFSKTDKKIINKLTRSKEFGRFLDEKAAHLKRPRVYYLWPNIALINLKVSRKQIIEAVLKAELAAEAK